MTQGALFKHFASRDAIWLAVMQWVRETLLAAGYRRLFVDGRVQDVDALTPSEALAGGTGSVRVVATTPRLELMRGSNDFAATDAGVSIAGCTSAGPLSSDWPLPDDDITGFTMHG